MMGVCSYGSGLSLHNGTILSLEAWASWGLGLRRSNRKRTIKIAHTGPSGHAPRPKPLQGQALALWCWARFHGVGHSHKPFFRTPNATTAFVPHVFGPGPLHCHLPSGRSTPCICTVGQTRDLARQAKWIHQSGSCPGLSPDASEHGPINHMRWTCPCGPHGFFMIVVVLLSGCMLRNFNWVNTLGHCGLGVKWPHLVSQPCLVFA